MEGRLEAMSATTEITTGTTYQEKPLDKLREACREENNKARSAARKSLEHVRNCGEILTVIKSKIPHGNWIHELRSLRIERRTATNYMRIFEKWETVSHLNHGVKDALKLLASEHAPPPTPKPSAPSAPSAPSTTLPAKVSAKTSLPLGATYQDAVIVKTEPTKQCDEPETPSAPSDKKQTGNAFLTIMEQLPELDQSELRRLIEIIKTRWIRDEKKGDQSA